MKIVAAKKILKANDQLAAANRRFFHQAGVFVVNILGSPGGGKTTLIESLASILNSNGAISVIEGDLAGTVDADRLSARGLPVVQITTEGACHLDANMVAAALDGLPLSRGGWLFIENVGNLVCPAGFDLGENLRIVILSVPEGDDKVIKYPTVFQSTQAVVISKVDLLPYFEFQPQRVRETLSRLNPQASVFEVSAKTGQGMGELAEWLIARRTAAACEVAG
ncbi:hydrogenase nickel incorporation protein HypB [Thermogutta sp.]|jgi:hydrogenase nickel incorporation protein HypB|uniref:hydrogenase nickel incorporation protein HypB n=1 Tax=Thermogutta sp. TaxID=1962930 RepID=UPI00321F6B7B